jgi:hypothetical protein
MDKALFTNKRSKFGTIVYATQANKRDSDQERYRCLGCGESVFLRQGDVNAHCFAHHKSESSNIDKECELRVSSQYASYSTGKSDVQYIQKWFQQHSEKDLEYNPHLPDFIFKEVTTWQAIANVLISEIMGNRRYNRDQFEKELFRLVDLSSSSITRFMIDFEKVSESELMDFYWEIYLRFRLLYRLYNSGKRKSATGYYKELFRYFDENLKSTGTSQSLVPFTFTFDVDIKRLDCAQYEEGKLKREIDFASNPPYSLSYRNQTPEVSDIHNCKYIIATYDPFQDSYTSTNKQIPIGTQILIVGEKEILERIAQELRPFSNEPIELIGNVTGLAESWGVIDTIINNPENMSLSDCPSWIAWRYLELIGGLKIKTETKSYMLQCPPLVELNGNIPTSLIDARNGEGEPVTFKRNENTLRLDIVETGEYVIQIVDTPYSLNFFICETRVQKFSENDRGWVFHEKQWPAILTIDETCKKVISGVSVIGFDDHVRISKEKEWFLLHSQFRNHSSFAITKGIIGGK